MNADDHELDRGTPALSSLPEILERQALDEDDQGSLPTARTPSFERLPASAADGSGASHPAAPPPPGALMPVTEAYRGKAPFATARPKGPSRLVPLVSQLRGYTRSRFRVDAIAGLTVAALTLPSSMAYADVAGVPVTTGLYTLILPVLIYAVLSSTPRTVVGPEGTVALVTGTAVAPLAGGDPGRWVLLVSMLAVMTGVVFLVARVARIGWMADYLSQAVLVGYIAGVAIVLIIGQIGKLTGIPSADGNALRELWGYLTNLSATNPATLAIGLAAMGLLVVMRALLPTWPSALIVVVLGITAAWSLDLAADGVQLVGPVPSGLPPLEIPAVGTDDVMSLVVPAIGIFLVSFSDAILISRAIAAKNRETVDANQELLAFGASNVAAGLTAGMPIGASGSRTAVNDDMKVTSQVGGLVNALAVALILLFLTGPIQYLPTAVLAAIIIVASVGIIEASAWLTLHRASRAEVLIALVTAFLVLTVGVLQALAIAVFLSMAEVVRRIANPHDAVQGYVPSIGRFGNVSTHPDAAVLPGIVVYRLDDRIFFANAQRVHGRIRSAIKAAPKPVNWLVFDVAGVPDTDAAAQAMLLDLKADLDRDGIGLVFSTMRESLRLDLLTAGILDVLGPDNLYETDEAAVAACRERTPPAGRRGRGQRQGT
jgi:high affinity sulfate transporter 1